MHGRMASSFGQQALYKNSGRILNSTLKNHQPCRLGWPMTHARVHAAWVQHGGAHAVARTHASKDAHATQQDARAYLKQRLSLSIEEAHLRGLSVQRDLEPNISLLCTIQSQQRVASLLRAHPELLGVQLGAWLEFLLAYGMSAHFFFKLLSTNPSLFTRGSLFTAGQTMMFLQSLGLSVRDISAHIIPRAAEVLQLSTALEPVVSFLVTPPEPQGGPSALAVESQGPLPEPTQHKPATAAPAGTAGAAGTRSTLGGLGLNPDELRSLLSRCPRVLLMSVEEDLAPRLAYLTHDMGFTPEEATRLLTLNSSLLLAPVAPQLQSHLAFLNHTCGFDSHQAKQLLISCADLLVFSTGNLERKWNFLTNTVFGAATQAATQAFTQQPLKATSTSTGQQPPSHLTSAPSSTGQQPSSSSPIQQQPCIGSACPSSSLGAQEAHGDPLQVQGQQAPHLNGPPDVPHASHGSHASHASHGEHGSHAQSAARAAVLAYPNVLSKSLLGDMGPRFSYACDRGLLHHLLDYDEQTAAVSLSLGRMLDCDTTQYVVRVCGDEEDFADYCAQWRRTQAGKLTLTAINPAEASW